jgi:excisionase family DNA binding protein
MTTPTAHAEPEKYVPTGTAAKMLHCDLTTLRRWEAAGKIKAWRTPGNQRRFKVADLEALLQGAGADAA